MQSASDALRGALMAGAWVVSLFFWRFFTLSRERLFLFFALAFGVLGLDWGMQAILHPGAETRHLFYLFRLLGYLLIIVGIVDKNRTTKER